MKLNSDDKLKIFAILSIGTRRRRRATRRATATAPAVAHCRGREAREFGNITSPETCQPKFTPSSQPTSLGTSPHLRTTEAKAAKNHTQKEPKEEGNVQVAIPPKRKKLRNQNAKQKSTNDANAHAPAEDKLCVPKYKRSKN